MAGTLDEEFLDGCEPHILDVIERELFAVKGDCEYRKMLISARAEILGLQRQVTMLSRTVDSLSRELESMNEAEEHDANT